MICSKLVFFKEPYYAFSFYYENSIPVARTNDVAAVVSGRGWARSIEDLLRAAAAHAIVEGLIVELPALGVRQHQSGTGADGATAEEVCAKTIRTLLDAGARHFYISNLPVQRAQHVLANILEKAGVTT